MPVSEAEALAILPLSVAKLELRIPADILEQDALLIAQIQSAVSFVAQSTGRAVDDLTELRPAVIAAVRAQYDGDIELPKSTTFDAWLDPFRSYKAG